LINTNDHDDDGRGLMTAYAIRRRLDVDI